MGLRAAIRARRSFLVLVLALASVIFGCSKESYEIVSRNGPSGSAVSLISEPTDAYGKLPLSFEANRGQVEGEVRFLSRAGRFNLFLTATEAVLVGNPARAPHPPKPARIRSERADQPGFGPTTAAENETAFLRITLEGAAPDARISGLHQLPGTTHYLTGNDPSQWRVNVPSYARVRYEAIYPGVDLVYYGNGGELEFDFIVAPGTDPGVITLALGGGQLEMGAGGEVVMTTEDAVLRLHRPVVYQEIDNARKDVAGRFVLKGDGRVGFQVGAHDSTRPIIIDPILSYSTYLGGDAFDFGFAIAVDSSGSAHVAGSVVSTNFPTANPAQENFGGGEGGDRGDAFVAKLNPAGTALVYSTYFGGSDNDQASAITTDAAGNAYVTGTTLSTDFPTASAFQGDNAGNFDVFVAKFGPSGSLLYSTYIGGADFDRADGIAVDPEGDIYITGRSLSGDYPLRNAFQIPTGGFVTKLNASGSALVYSTFLDNFREGWGIAVDSSGSAYVAGPGTEPVWVHRLNAEGTGLVYSTEIGGSQYDFFLNRGRIALDAAGNAYVTGHTSSPSFRTTNALQPVMAGTSDAFVAKLNGTGTLAYSTFLGGSGGEEGLGIAADAAGNAYITGWTTSADFPTANPLYEATAATSSFIAKLDSSGSFLSFSTSVPGASPVAIAVDAAQAIYATGGAESQGIPVSNALQSTYAGGETDAFVMKIGSSAETAETTFATNEGGGISQVATASGVTTPGYGRIAPTGGSATPAGVAIFGFRQDGVLVSEAGVPALLPVSTGRIYVEIDGTVNTGVAMANGSDQAVNVRFFFTDGTGQDSPDTTITIPADEQLAQFVTESPFNQGPAFRGTMTFVASAPIGVVALRGLTNQRSEFLITTLPVAVLGSAGSDTLVVPHFADGGGWTTSVVLVNPTDGPQSGMVQFLEQGTAQSIAEPALVTIEGQPNSTFAYSVPARAALRLQTSGTSPSTQSGSLRVVPSEGGRTPDAFVIFSYTRSGVTVSEASVRAEQPGSAFRVYAEASGSFQEGEVGSIQSGIAIANTSPTPANVTLELATLRGTTLGLTGSLTVPGRGQVAVFLNEIPGFEILPREVRGVLRVATPTGTFLGGGITVVGLRARYNERQDFLITTIPAVNESAEISGDEALFPHLAVGGGYATQLVLFSGSRDQSTSGSLRFVDQSGSPLNLVLALQETSTEPVFAQPEIISILPSTVTVSGGEMVTVRGRNFSADSVIVIGHSLVSAIQFVDTQTLTFPAPALSSGLQTLTVANAGKIVQTSIAVRPLPLAALSAGEMTTIAGGTTYVGDGAAATSAVLHYPGGIAADSDGNLYLADTLHRRVRKVDGETGVITTVAGNGSFRASDDGLSATAAIVPYPVDLTLDGDGNIYILNSNLIQKVFADSGIIASVAGGGTFGELGDGGPATNASFSSPTGIALDPSGNVFITDSRNHRVRKVDASTGSITTIAGLGTALISGDGGPAREADLNFPGGIAINSRGDIFFTDDNNQRIRKIDMTTGLITTLSNRFLDPQTGLAFGGHYIAIGGSGQLYVSDVPTPWVRRFDPETGFSIVIAGSGVSGSSGDGGPAKSASFRSPFGTAVDASGNVFISDRASNRIRKVLGGSGIISTLAGTGDINYFTNDVRADLTAIDKPAGVTFDQAGHLYVSEQGTSLAGSARQIRRVDAQTGIISLFAGGGTLTADDVGASEADITPGALITTSAGDILFADVPFGNARVRKIEALTGSVTTVAGGGDSIADDGPATLARLRSIRQIALDLEGNLYIADSVDNRIRRVDADTQLITTVAGTGERGLSGDGGVATLARLASPSGLVVDPGGNLFVADSENNRIRHVDAVTGTITTIAQLTSRPGYLLLDDAGTLFVALPSGIGAVPGAIGAVSATVSTLPFRPTGDALQTFPTARALALDSAGNLVIADGQNNRVRAVRAPIP